MAQFFTLHPANPQPRLVRQAAQLLREGAVIVYPTDSGYALGCAADARQAAARIRRIRALDENHPFTCVCRDLADVGRYARMDNQQYRLVRGHHAEGFTFILRASRDMPRHAQNSRRNTIGVRVASHPVAAALVAELGGPLLSTTLWLPGDDAPLDDAETARARLGHAVDLVLDAGPCRNDPTTVVDLSGDAPRLVRGGRGDPAAFGLSAAADED